MDRVFFALPGNELLTASLASKSGAEIGNATIRHFPDGETYIKINSDVRGKKVIMICTLDYPDAKLLPLYFLGQTAKELGANATSLIAPYLAYMRQDKRFHSGEAITSSYFGKLISSFADELLTVDPHLHRRTSLSEIYTIPTTVVHAAGLISDWIRENVVNPVLIGPDSESEQWVSEVANNAGAPYTVLEKIRSGERDVTVSIPHVEQYKSYTPVLVDDIISTARTMIATIGQLRGIGLKKPVCIGVHGIFAGTAYQDLMDAGAETVITSNTILHETNRIPIEELLLPYMLKLS